MRNKEGQAMNTTETKQGLFATLGERVMADTPPFFKKLRLIGLGLAAAGGVLVAAPIALPAALVTAGGHLIVAGSVATAISQITKKKDEE
jgi:hypothetical protein